MSKSIDIRGHQFFYDTQEEFWKTVERGEWEAYSFDILEKYIEPGKTFIDLGAWNGVLAMYAAKLGAAIVIATEPDTEARVMLYENVEANGLLDQMFIKPLAISGHDGTVIMNSNSFGDSTSNIVGRGFKKQAAFCKTLKSFCEEYAMMDDVCLIKMDIEGAEKFVLPEAHEWLKERKPKLYISFHPGYFSDNYSDKEKSIVEIIDALFSIYRVYGVIYNNDEYSPNDFMDAMHTPHDHSFLFIPR